MSDRTKENRVRRLAGRAGYSVHKARGIEHINNQELYMLVESSRNAVVLGERV